MLARRRRQHVVDGVEPSRATARSSLHGARPCAARETPAPSRVRGRA
jgi:hypothetical protein